MNASATSPAQTLTKESNSTAGLNLINASCCICGYSPADPVAVGEDFEYRTSSDLFLAMRCKQCGLIYLNPRPAASELNRIYPPDYHAYDFSPASFKFVYSVRRRLEAKRLLKVCGELGAGASILDVGCGDGFHLQLLRDFGDPTWHLMGIDMNPLAVSKATESGLNVIESDIETANLEEMSYDLVLLIATIEHVADPACLLAAVRRLLKPGGRVLVVTDNTRTLDFRIFGRRHWGGYHFPRHWCLFNSDNLRALAGNAGLEIDEIHTIVSPVNWVYSIRNWLVDAGAPSWMIDQFSLKAPAALALFTLIDGAFVFARRGALLRMIARRAECP